ncbi:Transposase IS116/IS110/IS902 family protein [compost metagenome]
MEQWQPASNRLYELRMLTRRHEGVQKSKSVLINQLEALEHGRLQQRTVSKQLRSCIKLLDKQLVELKREIQQLIEKDAVLTERTQQLCSIKGVGMICAATVIAETNGFALFKNQSQLVSFAGYDVIENQSGRQAGKTRISKKGNSHIRRILHLPAFSVVKLKVVPFTDLYERIMQHQPSKMKAYVAVQKKLLILLYTLWKKNEPYKKDKVSPTSGVQEAKFLFQVNAPNTVAPKYGATQDELPSVQSA